MNYITNFMEEKRLSSSPLTIKQYDSILNKFLSYINRPLNTVTRTDIINYLNYLLFTQKMAKTTVANIQSVIKSFYTFMTNNKYIEVNPTENIENVKIDKKVPVYLTTNEITKLLYNTKNDTDKLMVEILFATGVRVSELVNIKKTDINFDKNIIKVFGKGAKERVVLIPETLCKKLKQYCQNLNDNEAICPYSVRTIERKIKTLSIKTGINKNITPHKLRHSFATHMIQNGGDIVAVQKLLGHSSLNTTQIYTHYNVEELRNVYNRVYSIKEV